MRYPRYFRLGIPALVALIGVAGFVLTTSLLAADREAEVKRRAQLQSVRAQGVLASARAYVAGLGNVLESETTRTQRRFVELAGSATSGVGLIDVFWVQRVPASERARYEQRTGVPITRLAGGRFVRAPEAATYLPATFTSSTSNELNPGTDVSGYVGLPEAIGDRSRIFGVSATRPGNFGDQPGLYLLEAADYGRGPDRRGYLAVFVPRGWLTVGLGQDPSALAVHIDGRELEGPRDLGRGAAQAEYTALGRRWRIDVAERQVAGWEAALPWIALAWPVPVTLLVGFVGRGILGRRRAERDFERVFHLSLDLLCIAGFDGYLKRVNPAFERTLGYTNAELLTRPMEEMVHPDDRAEMRAAIEQLARGEELARFENRVLGADGSMRTVEWSARPLAEEGLLYATGRDITERLRMERRMELLAQEQAALRRVATLVAHDASPGEVLESVAGEVRSLLGADSTRLLRYEDADHATIVAGNSGPDTAIPIGERVSLEGDNLPAVILRSGRAARQAVEEDDAGPLAARVRELGIRAAVGAPVAVEGRLWGIMVAAWTRPVALPDDTEHRMEQFTELVAVAIANAESRTQLAASRARVIVTADETRRRIERDLHDSTQQRLVSLGLELRATEAALPDGLTDLKARISSTAAGVSEVLEEVQEISRGIHPAILSTGGLGPALRTLARRSAMPVELELELGERLPQAVEAAVYFIVSEALTNAAKHAGATYVAVAGAVRDGAVVLEIHDDGAGGADPAKGSGLVGLRDRVEALDGTIAIASPAGAGTTLSVKIPVIEGRE